MNKTDLFNYNTQSLYVGIYHRNMFYVLFRESLLDTVSYLSEVSQSKFIEQRRTKLTSITVKHLEQLKIKPSCEY